MSGICGLASTGGHDPQTAVARMANALEHRGPDGITIMHDHAAVLAHARLGIGTEASNPHRTGSRWAMLDGELLNRDQLRGELMQHGHSFHTWSDAEIVLASWQQWGPRSLERFNGHWAIAVWDSERKQLTLARDRTGICPLFYYQDSTGLAFASEVKALFAHNAVPREFDPSGLDQTFTYWSPIAPQTVFRDVKQLPPGCWIVHEHSRTTTKPWWRPSFPLRGQEPLQDLEDNSRRLREELTLATRLRLSGEEPVAAYLSGGIDSAATAQLMAELVGEPDTFSIRFTEADFDESHYQQVMARHLGSRHHTIEVSQRDIANVFDQVVWHCEAPLLRTAPAPLLLLSRAVRDGGFRSIISGEGSDELLGGYDIFRENRLRQFWSRNPEASVRNRAVELLYPWLSRNPNRAPAFARGFFGEHLRDPDLAISHHPRWKATSVLKNLLSTEIRDRIEVCTDENYPVNMPAPSKEWDPLSRAQWLEIVTLLPGYILSSQGDRMLLANSVNGRFPFLDPTVIQLSSQLAARHKLFGLEEKFVLKHAFANRLPNEILQRPKQPYRAPDAASFFPHHKAPERIRSVLTPRAVSSAGIFDPEQVSGLISKAEQRSHLFGNTDNMRVVAVISTQLLHEQFLEPGPASTAQLPTNARLIDLTSSKRDSK